MKGEELAKGLESVEEQIRGTRSIVTLAQPRYRCGREHGETRSLKPLGAASRGAAPHHIVNWKRQRAGVASPPASAPHPSAGALQAQGLQRRGSCPT